MAELRRPAEVVRCCHCPWAPLLLGQSAGGFLNPDAYPAGENVIELSRELLDGSPAELRAASSGRLT